MNGTSGFQELRSSTSRPPSYRYRFLHEQRHQFGEGSWFLLCIHDLFALSKGISTRREKVPDSVLSRSIAVFGVFVAVLCVSPPPVLSADVVPLPSGSVEPSKTTTKDFLRALKSAPSGVQHGLATFRRHLTEDDRRSLAAYGLHVLSPFQRTTYRVRVEKRVDMRAVQATKLNVRLIRLQPEDRVNPQIWREEFDRYKITPPGKEPRNYVLNPNGTLNLTVRFHLGIPKSKAKRVLQTHGKTFKMQSDVTWVAVVPRTGVRALATEDVVQWIDTGPLPFLPENDHTREAINVDAVQNFNTTTGPPGLGGNGVQVGIFDTGVDQTHPDFSTSRVILTDPDMKFHGTHVAGIVAGNGTLSQNYDLTSCFVQNVIGTPFQWRGMAPEAQLIEVVTDFTTGFPGADATKHRNYIRDQGMDLSNHSYPVSLDGAYDTQNQLRDELIRGDALVNAGHVPGQLHIYSAGNLGGGSVGFGHQVGYFSLTKQVKNGLVVGNWNFADCVIQNQNQIGSQSSLGPAYDGRIKPDVVAPGIWITSTCIDDTFHQCKNNGNPVPHGYGILEGTSMAAPAVTGALALVLQQYATTYNVNLDTNPPLPSTLRAVMIHTATDKSDTVWFCNADGPSTEVCPVAGGGHAHVQATVGPDFVTGWGLINAQAATNIVANQLLREDSVMTTCDTKTYVFNVPPGTAGMRVTMAWDDFAGDPTLPHTDPQLVNDLDLILVDPNGKNHYPWQLNQNIKDSNNVLIADDQQQCGNAVTVDRLIMPATMLGAPDPIPGAVIPPAIRGRDHLNNVEVVDVDTPDAGTWQVLVIGFNIPQGPQHFSLVGQSFLLPAADTTPPTQVTGVTAVPAQGQVTLSWLASTDTGGSGLAGYNIMRCTNMNCTGPTLIANVGAAMLSFANGPLAAGTTYGYAIVALDQAGNSALPSSPIVYATTPVSATNFWSEDFENHLTPNWDTSACGGSPQDGCNPSISTDVAHGGSHSLKSNYPTMGVQAGTFINRTIPPSVNIYQRWFEYTVGFTYNFIVTKDMVVHGQDDATGGPRTYYSHLPGDRRMSGTFAHTGWNTPCPNGPVDTICNLLPNMANISQADGQWYCIETHTNAGSVGGSDGSVEMWINGTQTVGYYNLPMRSVNSLYNIVSHYAQFGFGARYIDDLAVGDARIGCVVSSSDTTQPMSPRNLRVN